MILPFFVFALAAGVATPSTADAVDGEVREVSWVGFKHSSATSRVFVTTTEPVHYTVDTSVANLVVLTLDNTRVPILNTTRGLPTQFFKGPVTHVAVKNIEGASPSVRIEVQTRRRVHVQPHKKDTLLALDFANLL
jgi:hypothetical protein